MNMGIICFQSKKITNVSNTFVCPFSPNNVSEYLQQLLFKFDTDVHTSLFGILIKETIKKRKLPTKQKG